MSYRKVLVVIVSYKHTDVLERCLHYLNNQTYPDIDISVWDNGAESLGIEKNYPKVNFTFSKDNILWSPAVNRSIEKHLTDHSYILVMNHDIMLPSVGIERLVNGFSKVSNNPGVIGPAGSGIGGMQDYASHRTIPAHKDWETDLQDLIANCDIARASYLTGAIQMIKREVYDAIGGLDEEMPLGADDFDYSIRVKEAGFSLWAAYNVYVNHIGHVTQDSSNWNEFGEISWKRFNEKYDGYYASEEEAIGSMWGSKYNPQFPIGTGMSLEEKINRGILNVPR